MAKRLTKREREFKKLDDRFDDLPDGAYFEVMREHGFEVEELIELSESIATKEGK